MRNSSPFQSKSWFYCSYRPSCGAGSGGPGSDDQRAHWKICALGVAMNKKAILTTVALAVFCYAAFPAAAQKIIPCPINAARTEITTPLPAPWWQTPQRGTLQSTRVSVVAGRRVLVCSYRAYGTTVSVMRPHPEGGGICRAVSNGFAC